MGIFDDITDVVEDAIDVSIGVTTLGMYGDITKHKVARLITAGMTIAAAAEAFGVAESVIEAMIDDG